jgi:F420-dependent oxidoreductase-like protein
MGRRARGRDEELNLGVNVGIAGNRGAILAVARSAQADGYSSVWVSESNGRDAISVAAYLACACPDLQVGSAAIQMFTRTPSAVAMAAASLSELSDGRFTLGLGTSTEEILAGWHGVSVSEPLGRAREYIEIVRRLLERPDERLNFDGGHYQIPLRGHSGGFRIRIDATIPAVPIYLAAVGRRAVKMAADVCDGWLSLFYSPERSETVYATALSGVSAEQLDVAAVVPLVLGPDLDACRTLVKPWIANYIGDGRTSPYARLFAAYGWAEIARSIGDMLVSGRRQAAADLVPDCIVDELALVGSAARIRDRLQCWKETRVSTLILGTVQADALTVVADAM